MYRWIKHLILSKACKHPLPTHSTVDSVTLFSLSNLSLGRIRPLWLLVRSLWPQISLSTTSDSGSSSRKWDSLFLCFPWHPNCRTPSTSALPLLLLHVLRFALPDRCTVPTDCTTNWSFDLEARTSWFQKSTRQSELKRGVSQNLSFYPHPVTPKVYRARRHLTLSDRMTIRAPVARVLASCPPFNTGSSSLRSKISQPLRNLPAAKDTSHFIPGNYLRRQN